MSWAERARDRLIERAERRIDLCKRYGPELPLWFVFGQWLASYCDLAYIAVLRWFLPREEEE